MTFRTLIPALTRATQKCLLRTTLKSALVVGLGVVAGNFAAQAQAPTNSLKLARIFTDSAVLQRGQPVQVWGWAKPNAKVTVSCLGQKVSAKAQKDGYWRLSLAPLNATGTFELQVTEGKESLLRKGLVAGEVFIASGQSNMEWKLKQKVNNYLAEARVANFPNIRYFDVTNHYTAKPLTDLVDEKGRWTPVNPTSVLEMSAVAYFFSRNLHEEQQVPIGIIQCEWGGTHAEAWTSAEALRAMGPDFVQTLDEIAAEAKDASIFKARQEAEQKAWEAAVQNVDQGAKPTSGPVWWEPSLNDQSWASHQVPGRWESNGLPNYDGIVYYRTSFTWDGSATGNTVKLSLGTIDDHDEVWLNGTKIGSGEGWDVKRVYSVPASALKQGKNQLTVRVFDTGGDGGFTGDDANGLHLDLGNGKKINLAGYWYYKAAVPADKVPAKTSSRKKQNDPSVLFNGMLNPLIPYTMKGVIWYQGESNAAKAKQYRRLFPTMIKDWRQRWGQGDFPFLWVQLANYRAEELLPKESTWAELREAQTMTLSLPNTGQACIIDIGEAQDIHPKNKQDVGLRLYKAAQKVIYGKEVIHRGPTYRSHKVATQDVVVYFDNLGGRALQNRNKYGYVRSFALAGEDGKWHWAKGEVNDDHVILRSAKVPAPKHVRYAWADNPGELDLYNLDGLPMEPFRTDDLPGITADK